MGQFFASKLIILNKCLADILFFKVLFLNVGQDVNLE